MNSFILLKDSSQDEAKQVDADKINVTGTWNRISSCV